MKRRALTIAIAPDSFKGTLTAPAAAACMAGGLRKALPRAQFVLIPMADGGEGTVDALVAATDGSRLRCRARDPLGRSIRVVYGMTGDGRTAIIEMAAASGLLLLAPHERNPLKTSTAGTGDMIRAALDRGVQRVLIGIGGSATNDGGTGMARALGVRFLDAAGRELPEGGGALGRLARIDMRGIDPRLKRVSVEVACDVTNALCGARGAAHVYGPQKGATPAMVRQLDANLRQLAAVIQRDLGIRILNLRGSGAAGGLGGGLRAFVGGQLRPGVEIVIDCVRLKERLRHCDLVITGEGRMDGQTVYGKAPVGVARVAKSLGLPVIAICGSLGDRVARVHGVGIDAVFGTTAGELLEEALMAGARRRLRATAEEVGRLLAVRVR
ncbi:MAG: glycerate kinase [Verrucomicrobia bacterium]|nr:glycerate kinase [Verrucomicrobiota bacterium]